MVRIDVWYHPTKFQLNRIRNVGCESIWKFQEASPHGKPLEGSGKIQLWCWMLGLMSGIIQRCEAPPHSAPWEEIGKSGGQTGVRPRVSACAVFDPSKLSNFLWNSHDYQFESKWLLQYFICGWRIFPQLRFQCIRHRSFWQRTSVLPSIGPYARTNGRMDGRTDGSMDRHLFTNSMSHICWWAEMTNDKGRTVVRT